MVISKRRLEITRTFIRKIRLAWLRFKFATGRWKGIMIHADRYGRLGRSFHIEGLRLSPYSPEYRVTRDGEELICVSPRRQKFGDQGKKAGE